MLATVTEEPCLSLSGPGAHAASMHALHPGWCPNCNTLDLLLIACHCTWLQGLATESVTSARASVTKKSNHSKKYYARKVRPDQTLKVVAAIKVVAHQIGMPGRPVACEPHVLAVLLALVTAEYTGL